MPNVLNIGSPSTIADTNKKSAANEQRTTKVCKRTINNPHMECTTVYHMHMPTKTCRNSEKMKNKKAKKTSKKSIQNIAFKAFFLC